MTKEPKKFVGLHAHSLSIGDSIDYPQEHIDSAIANGMDSLALTDHGHMNGLVYQYLHWKKLKHKGIDFKPIYGIEAYYVDSLENWKNLYNEDKLKKHEAKLLAKKAKSSSMEDIGNEFMDTKDEFSIIQEESEDATVLVEDENESKKNNNKWANPINQRNHIVLLAKNYDGLKALYKLCSMSYIEGYYRYPRIDLNMLKKYSNGNIIASTACVAGRLNKAIFDNQIENNFDLWEPNNHNFDLIQQNLKELSDGFIDALGKENFYLELQFNRLGAQHLANQHLIHLSKSQNIPLIVTCDSHYAKRENWREREIYKLMAWSSKNKKDIDKNQIPKSIDDLKCELYPKNASEVWNTYKQTTKDKNWDFYDDQLVIDAIERTYSIAHDQIDDFDLDTKVKLPSLTTMVGESRVNELKKELGDGYDEDKASFRELKTMALNGAKYRKIDNNQEYIDRLKYELKVVRDLKFSKYFVTYSKMMKHLEKTMILGPARGSAAGSLLAYVLNITQVDPIKYGLLFERFLVPSKKGYPDIDCMLHTTLVKTKNGNKSIGSLTEQDYVYDTNNELKKVIHIKNRMSTKDDVIYSLLIKHGTTYANIVANHNHRLISYKNKEIYVKDIRIGTKLKGYINDNLTNECIVEKIEIIKDKIELTDITVEDTKTFQFVPFDCLEVTSNSSKTLISIHDYSIDTDYENIISNSRRKSIFKLD